MGVLNDRGVAMLIPGVTAVSCSACSYRGSSLHIVAAEGRMMKAWGLKGSLWK
jgi:hypothetical protein